MNYKLTHKSISLQDKLIQEVSKGHAFHLQVD